MSETELWTGKLKRVMSPLRESTEQKAKGILVKREIVSAECEKPRDCSTFLACLLEEFYGEFVVYKGELYEVEGKKHEDCDVMTASKNTDGSIDFVVSFYNGSCGLSEALESALESMEGGA
jgi:hypothetical protein